MAATPQDLSAVTIGELARLPSFGKQSLLDLLGAVKRVLTDLKCNVDESGKEESSQGEQKPSKVPDEASVFDIDAAHLPASLLHLPPAIAGLHLPAAPDGTAWGHLRLQARTETRVRKLVKTPQELSVITVGQLARLMGFGKTSLIDLLGAIKAALGGSVRVPTEASKDLIWNMSAAASSVDESANHVVHATLESELASCLNVLKTQRPREIAWRVLGWDGRGTATLQQVGDEFGITRERVRQICARVLRPLEDTRPFAPVLDRVLAAIREAPHDLLAADLEAKLQSLGLTERLFRLEGVIKAAEVLGRETGFGVKQLGNQRFVVWHHEYRLAPRVLGVARRSVRRWGAGTVVDIAAQVQTLTVKPRIDVGSDQAAQIVTEVLRTQNDFRWLDEVSGWFWFFDALENSLLTRIRKVLAVAGRVDVSELRAAISRDRRMRGFSPPRRVLTELCQQVPWCRVEEPGVIIADPPLSRDEALSRNERLFAEILSNNGPLMDGAKLEEMCVRAGMTRPTFWAKVSGSPIVLRYAPRIYGLIGANIEPGMIDSLAPARRLGRVMVDYGWVSDRQIWLGYKLSQGMIRNGVFGVPAAMKRFLEGEYTLTASDGAWIGKLVVRGNSGWGLGPFYSRRGGETGDWLLVRFDLAAHKATIDLGQDDLIEEYRATTAVADLAAVD